MLGNNKKLSIGGFMWLVDTCVIIRGAEGKGAPHKIFKELLDNSPDLGLTDFTLAELKARAKHHIYKIVREHLLDSRIFVTGVRPGNWKGEKAYEIMFDPNLLRLVPDPSDAVLIAAAEHYGLNGVITLDRHDLYTTKLENYLEEKGLLVLKPNEYTVKDGKL